jgi:uncharacterized protein (DUF1697 family)
LKNRYVALLRGINVGGNNMIKMADLKACFEALGFTGVATYIQSGNVVFTTGESGPDKLAQRAETAIAETFGCASKVVLRSRKQMQDIVGRAPAGFGAAPDRYRYDVIFLKPPLTAAAAMKAVPTKEGVDQAHAGAGVLYFSRLIARATQSRLGKIAALPIYKDLTIRNWNTTTALLKLLEAR